MRDSAGEVGTNSYVKYSYGPPHMAEQKQDDQLEHTYSSCVRIHGVALKTCQRWWTIGRSGERVSGISVLVTRPDDDISIQLIHTITMLLIYTCTHARVRVCVYTLCSFTFFPFSFSQLVFFFFSSSFLWSYTPYLYFLIAQSAGTIECADCLSAGR